MINNLREKLEKILEDFVDNDIVNPDSKLQGDAYHLRDKIYYLVKEEEQDKYEAGVEAGRDEGYDDGFDAGTDEGFEKGRQYEKDKIYKETHPDKTVKAPEGRNVSEGGNPDEKK